MGKAKISERMAIVLLCKDMGWTYQDYCRQPAWYLDLLELMRNEDAAQSRKQNK